MSDKELENLMRDEICQLLSSKFGNRVGWTIAVLNTNTDNVFSASNLPIWDQQEYLHRQAIATGRRVRHLPPEESKP